MPLPKCVPPCMPLSPTHSPPHTPSPLSSSPTRRWVVFGTLSGGFWLLLLAVWAVRKVLLSHYQYRLWRLVRTAVVLAFIAGLVCVIIFVPQAMSAGVGIKVRGCDEPWSDHWRLQLLMAGSAPLQLLPPARRSSPRPGRGPALQHSAFPCQPRHPPTALPLPMAAEPDPHRLCKLLCRCLYGASAALLLPRLAHRTAHRGPGVPVRREGRQGWLIVGGVGV